jgi:hypothetical protein
MDIASYIIIGCGVFFILTALFSKKKETVEVKISWIFIGVLSVLGAVPDGLTQIHSISFSSETALFLRFISHILWGMALGIILTLRIFGQFKFTRRN